MAEQIFEDHGFKYEIQLIPSKGGVFEVIVDGDLIFSKKDLGRHAEYATDIAPHL